MANPPSYANGCSPHASEEPGIGSTESSTGPQLWFPEDAELPDDHWRRQFDALDDSQFEGEDYKDTTLRGLDAIEVKWNLYCQTMALEPSTAYETISERSLFNFFDWMLSRKRGKDGRRLRGIRNASTLGLYWKQFRLVYERANKKKLPEKLKGGARRVLRSLVEKHKLRLKGREKIPMDVDDLTLLLKTNLTTTQMSYDHGRHRIEVCLFLILMSLSGNRPDAVLNLRYQDIEITLIRDSGGRAHSKVIEFTPEFTKGFLGIKEAIKWPIPEVLFDPTLVASPHVYLLGLLFADNAFAPSNLTCPADLDRLYIEPFLNQQRIPLKPELKDCYIFKHSRKALHGVTLCDDIHLKYSTLRPWLRKLACILGLKSFIPYSLRYNAITAFNKSNEVSDSLQNLMAQHSSIDVFVQHYLPRHVSVDARAIVHRLEPQRTIMKAVGSMSRSIDPRRPFRLTPHQSRSVNSSLRVKALVEKRSKLKQRGTHGNETDRTHYRNLNKALINERQRARVELLRNTIDLWETTQPIRDIERQLSGLSPDFDHTESFTTALSPQRTKLVETILTSPGNCYNAEVRRRTAAVEAVLQYCHFQEGGSTRGSQHAQVHDDHRVKIEAPLRLTCLEEAISSVHKRRRATRCFICVGTEELDMAKRVKTFCTTGDLSKHFRRRHLKPLSFQAASHCRLCSLRLRDVDHLRNHALKVHGVLT